MKYLFLVLFILLFVAGIGSVTYDYIMQSQQDELTYIAGFTGKDLGKTFAEEYTEEELKNSLQLSLVEVVMQQGANGQKDWELTAQWGTYSESTGNLLANEPDIIYYNRRTGEDVPVYISARKGKILEKNKLIIIENDVHIRQNDMVLKGDYSDFRPDVEIFSLPQGALFTQVDTIAKANDIQWDMKASKIQARGDVVIILNDDGVSFTLNTPRAIPPSLESINSTADATELPIGQNIRPEPPEI